MSQTVTISYCGIEALGRTMTEAKREAARHLTALVERASQSPEVVLFRGWAMLIWPTTTGWASSLLTNEGGELRAGPMRGGSYSTDDRATCRQRALLHIGQCAWVQAITDDAAYLDDFAKAGAGKNQVGFLRDWMVWQRAFFAAKAAEETRDAACMAPPTGAMVQP